MICWRSSPELEGKKVSLRVVSMSGSQPLDTGTATGRLMLAVIGAVGQAEREAMLERQREGIAKAKAQGRYKGRVPTVRRQAAEIMRLKEAGVRPSEIASRLGIGRASVYRVLGEREKVAARDVESAPNGAITSPSYGSDHKMPSRPKELAKDHQY